MAGVSRDQYQVLATVDPRLKATSALWDAAVAGASYSQAGPQAAQPVAAADDYELELQAAGTPTAAGSLEVECLEGGMPARDGRGAVFVWRNTSDDADESRGHEAPATLSGWEPVAWGTADDHTDPDTVTLDDDTVLQVATKDAADVVSYLRSTDGTWGSEVTVHDGTDQIAAKPALVKAGSRVLCIYGIASAVGTPWGIRISEYDADAGTWSVIRSNAVDDDDLVGTFTAASPERELRRIRAVYGNGQLLVTAWVGYDVASAHEDTLRQWASDDLGTKLTTVESWAGDGDTTRAGPLDLAYIDGHFVLVYVDSSGTFYCRRIGSAYQPFSTAERLNPSGSWNGSLASSAGSPSVISEGQCAVCVDDTGIMWCFIESRATNRGGVVVYSDDGGRTWTGWSRDPDDLTASTKTCRWWRNLDTGSGSAGDGNRPVDWSVTWQRGRVIMAHTCDLTDASTSSDSLCAAYLGGYTQHVHPPIATGRRWSDRSAWQHTLLPFELSGNQSNRTMTTAGTSAHSNSSGYEEITTGDGAGANGQRYTTFTDSTTGNLGLKAEWAAWGKEGAATTKRNVSAEFRLDDASHGVEIRILIGDTWFEVYDGVSGTQLDQVTGLADAPRHFRLGMYLTDGGATKLARLWYRGRNWSEDRQWTFVDAWTLTDDSGSVGNNQIVFGNVASAGAGTQVVSRWYWGPHHAIGEVDATASHVGQDHHWHGWDDSTDNPDNLSGRLYGAGHVYVADGVRIHATDGPARKGDTHTIGTRYEYPIERVFPAHSRTPREQYRSVNDSSSLTIPLVLDGTIGDTLNSTPLGSHLVAVFRGINWRTATLQYRNATTAWNTLVSIDAATGLNGLAYTREGNVIKPGASGVPYLFRGELAGFTAEFGGTAVQRRVVTNSEGATDSGYAGALARILLDGALAADPTSAGTLSLWSPEVTVVFKAQEAAGYRLVVDAQDTVDGDLRIGEFWVGVAQFLPRSYSWGRIVELEPGHDREVAVDGAARVVEPAPPARVAEVTWMDGIDTTDVHGAAPVPRYLDVSDTSGVMSPGALGATPYLLHGLAERLRGGRVSYLPSVAHGPPDTVHLVRRHQQIHGTLTSGVRIETIQGLELADEVVRVGPIIISEDV